MPLHPDLRPLLALVLATGALVGGSTVQAAGDQQDIEAARAGLAAFLDANRPASPSTSTDIPGCPAITLDRPQQSLGDVGIHDTIEDGEPRSSGENTDASTLTAWGSRVAATPTAIPMTDTSRCWRRVRRRCR